VQWQVRPEMEHRHHLHCNVEIIVSKVIHSRSIRKV
jgi:hypothetical protein